MRVFSIFLALMLSLLAGPVLAQCVGSSLLPDLRASDPAGVDAVFAAADQVPNAQGRFWRISRDGLAPSFMFGTFHSPEAIETVPDPVWARLDQARVALFELSQQEQDSLQMRIQSDINFIMDPSLPPLMDTLTAEQREVLTQAFQDRGLPAEAANQMRPWMLASLLGFPACHLRVMATGAVVLDVHMAQRAVANGVEEAGLETFDAALNAFGELTRDQLVAALVSTEKWIAMEEDIFRTHTELYRDGQIQAINEFGIWLAERENPPIDIRSLNARLMSGLLDDRNRAWMGRILAELAEGEVFIAVGALHLPGEAGLVSLIRDAGYQVERIEIR